MMKPKANTANTAKMAKRLLSYIISRYKATFAAVLFCIFVSAGATVASSLFLKTLVDGYITPLLTTGSTDFSGLLRSILTVGVIYLCGVLGTLLYNQLMVKVSQGTLKSIRDEMFAHMQKLPIRYFDTHAHGDIMSVYTNAVDTLRQLMSQSIPQVINSSVTILTSFVSMLVLDYAYNLPYRQIINSNNIGIAIMQGLSGSFGIVLAVPVTVALAVLLYTWRKAAPAA